MIIPCCNFEGRPQKLTPFNLYVTLQRYYRNKSAACAAVGIAYSLNTGRLMGAPVILARLVTTAQILPRKVSLHRLVALYI